MYKRVIAWILLIGFVLLIVNLIFIRYKWQFFLSVYLIIAVAFLLFFNPNKKEMK